MVVSVIILASFVGGVFATTSPTPPSALTPQTTSVDIVLFNNIPPAMQIWNIPSQLSIPEVNFTTTISFAPVNGVAHVTAAALTIIYNLSTSTGLPPTDRRVIVGINGQSSGSLALPVFGAVATASGFLGVQGLHPGSNMINIGLPMNDVVTLYEAHLTVEYTFLG